jgi:gamma-glutamyltranspeptidase/glutathione hydrolase
VNILEGYDMSQLGWSSSERAHLLVEAMRRAFADRATFFGDPDFVAVPVTGLTEKTYASRRRETINLQRASTSEESRCGATIGRRIDRNNAFHGRGHSGQRRLEYLHLNGAYGSGVVAKGTGVLLNNEMDDFTAKPGTLTCSALYRTSAMPSRPASARSLR